MIFSSRPAATASPYGTALTSVAATLPGIFRCGDAGAEMNEAPGAGPNQAPRQSAPGMGGPGEGKVQPIASVKDGFAYPKVGDLLDVDLQSK